MAMFQRVNQKSECPNVSPIRTVRWRDQWTHSNALSNLMIWIIAVFAVVACSGEDPAESEKEDEPIASVQEPMTGVGMEKLIPLRIVNVMDCNPALPTCYWKQRYNGMLRSIEAANEVFAIAGVQYFLKSFEAYRMPSFANLQSSFIDPKGSRVTWESVRP